MFFLTPDEFIEYEMPLAIYCTIILGASYCQVLWVTKRRLNSGAKMYKNVYLRIKNTWLCVCVSLVKRVCVCYRWECLESLGTVILDVSDKVGLLL